MNLVGAEIGRGLVSDGEAIARFSVGQGPHARIETAVRRVILTHEFREFCVSRHDLVFYRSFNLFAKRFAIRLRDRLKKLTQRVGEWTLIQRIVGNLLRSEERRVESM